MWCYQRLAARRSLQLFVLRYVMGDGTLYLRRILVLVSQHTTNLPPSRTLRKEPFPVIWLGTSAVFPSLTPVTCARRSRFYLPLYHRLLCYERFVVTSENFAQPCFTGRTLIPANFFQFFIKLHDDGDNDNDRQQLGAWSHTFSTRLLELYNFTVHRTNLLGAIQSLYRHVRDSRYRGG